MKNLELTTKSKVKTREEFEIEVRNLNLRMYRHLINNPSISASFVTARLTLDPHPMYALKVIDSDEGTLDQVNVKTVSAPEFKEAMKMEQAQFKRARELTKDMESLH